MAQQIAQAQGKADRLGDHRGPGSSLQCPSPKALQITDLTLH